MGWNSEGWRVALTESEYGAGCAGDTEAVSGADVQVDREAGRGPVRKQWLWHAVTRLALLP